MKKSFVFFIVLLLLVLSGMITANVLLLEQKDAVVITENVIYGDKSVVDGVKIQRNTKYDSHIHWKTFYKVGEEPDYHTDYEFSASGALTDRRERTYGIEVYANHVRNVDTIEDDEELFGLERAYKELLDETEPGEKLYKIISLADYLEYYVVDLEFDLPGLMIGTRTMDIAEIKNSLKRDNLNPTSRANLENTLKMIEGFHEMIKIPVLENHIYRIGVEKNLEGNLCSWGYSSVNGGSSTNGMDMQHNELPEDVDEFSFWISSAMTEDTCYFTFNTRTNEENIIDTSQMPQGYGIYAFTFDSEKGEIAIEGMKNVFPLNPEVYVLDLILDKQQENLLIFTEEENTRALTVVDLHTMKQKQQFLYADKAEEHHVYIYEDFMVIRYTWEKFAVLERNTDGSYTQQYSVNMEELGNLTEIYGEMIFDWNGEKLLVSDSLVSEEDEYYYGQNCGFYLAAFNKDGLLYYGEYKSSLDTKPEYIHYYFNCMPTEAEPLMVQW